MNVAEARPPRTDIYGAEARLPTEARPPVEARPPEEARPAWDMIMGF